MRVDVFRDGSHLGGYDISGQGEIRLGRGRDNHIILPDPQVSRHHASLFRQGERFLLMDRSTNGTFVKGERVEKAFLGKGGEAVLGPYLLRLAEGEPDWTRETEVPARDAAAYHGMIGGSAPMRDLFALVRKVAGSAGTALVLGETGSGKELVAQAIHDLSPRAGGPFVAINCGAISPELVESELFGHEKGAFTGATGIRRGAFEQAQGGTLFLDEVGELPPSLQPKLLRVLETGEIRRVGAQGAVKVDVRVIAATHRDLRKKVEEGTFRADLLYRLFVLPLRIPPLRERPADVLPLARYFLGGRCELTPQAAEKLLAHAWPGNVRELKNVLERACILRGGEPVGPGDLVFLDERPGDALPYGHTLEDLERIYYLRALEISGGNLRATARSLGIPKSTLHDRLKKYGLAGGGEEKE